MPALSNGPVRAKGESALNRGMPSSQIVLSAPAREGQGAEEKARFRITENQDRSSLAGSPLPAKRRAGVNPQSGFLGLIRL